ncbi:unnamed protein product [Heterobilharzia americana]|nr:unnamed protein product [Heterobilharzia americana]CAH8660463.1 unnamed protein product [Heterobilharzia americana]
MHKVSSLFGGLWNTRYQQLPDTCSIFRPKSGIQLCRSTDFVTMSECEDSTKEEYHAYQVFLLEHRQECKNYAKSSSELTINVFRQGRPLSTFLFNFVIDVPMEITLRTSNFSGID